MKLPGLNFVNMGVFLVLVMMQLVESSLVLRSANNCYLCTHVFAKHFKAYQKKDLVLTSEIHVNKVNWFLKSHHCYS